MAILYTLLAWGVILFAPRFLIGIFSSDKALILEMRIPFETVLRSLCFSGAGMWDRRCSSHWARKNSRFSSLCFARSLIVVPLAYILPYLFHMGSDGVFLAEPVSNGNWKRLLHRDAVYGNAGAETANGKENSDC